MLEPHITVVGNVAGPPRRRLTPTGVVVASFRIASTPRRMDKATQQWGDGETIWFTVSVWRNLADHCTDSLKKGDRVVVTGRLTTSTWQAEGEQRIGLEVDATSVGFDLAKGRATWVKGPTLSVGEDPWVSSGIVDPETGEVLSIEEAEALDPQAGALAVDDRPVVASEPQAESQPKPDPVTVEPTRGRQRAAA